MTVIEKLKTESMKLRKDRDPIASKLVFALSEIDKVGKNAGNRETTNDEAIKTIQKIISTVDQTIDLLPVNSSSVYDLQREKKILESVLPQMVSGDEIRSKLVFAFDGKQVRNKGEIMKWAKAEWGVLADMKQVGAIASELWGV